MKRWIQSFLAIDQVLSQLKQLSMDLSIIRAEITAITRDEFSPERRAASKSLGQKVQEQLIAQAKARDLTTDGSS